MHYVEIDAVEIDLQVGHVIVAPNSPAGDGCYNQGTVVTLQVRVPEGYAFIGFSSPVAAVNSALSPVSFTIEQPTAVTASFVRKAAPLPGVERVIAGHIEMK